MSVILTVFTVTGGLSWLFTALAMAWVVRDARKVRRRQRTRATHRAAEVVAAAEALLRESAGG